MVEELPTAADDLAQTILACRCADHLLTEYLRQPVAKAMRLDSPNEFDRAVAILADALREEAAPREREAMRAALARLDVDWLATIKSQREHLLREATVAAAAQLDKAPSSLRKTFARASAEVTAATRQDLRSVQGLSVGSAFSALDERMKEFMTQSAVLFVRDEYGRRSDTFSEIARSVVSECLAEGRGRDDIAAGLAGACKTLGKPGPYWELVAAAFIGRGRSYAQMSGYGEAGVTRYQIEAVMDERTSKVCQAFHGRVFEVSDAVASLDRAAGAADADQLRSINPWPARDATGVYLATAAGRVPVSEHTGNATLARAGLLFPPFHALCRSTTLAASKG